MEIKRKLAQTKQALATQARQTKTAINNSQFKEKTKQALVSMKEKTIEVKNTMVETTKDITRDIKQKYQNLNDNHDNNSHSPEQLLRSSSGSVGSVAPASDETRIFGETLEIGCMHSPVNYVPFLPDLVYKCMVYLYEKAPNEEGIFRLSGSAVAMKEMKDQFDRGIDVDLNSCCDPHAIAGLLKMYLRELPDSLFPSSLYVMSGENAVEQMKVAIENLTPTVKCLLSYLLRLLFLITSNEAVTKMSVNNLSIVFCPTLHCSSELLAFLINHANEIFVDETLLMETTLEGVEVGQEIYLVPDSDIIKQKDGANQLI